MTENVFEVAFVVFGGIAIASFFFMGCEMLLESIIDKWR